MDATIVCIDQTKKSVQVEPRAAWFPRGTRPSVELSGQREWTCFLGAIIEDGDRFFSRFTEYVTAEHAKHFILALCNEFEDNLIVMLDGAPYFQASAVTDLAARDDRLRDVPIVFAGVEPCRGMLETTWLSATASLTRSTSLQQRLTPLSTNSLCRI